MWLQMAKPAPLVEGGPWWDTKTVRSPHALGLEELDLAIDLFGRETVSRHRRDDLCVALFDVGGRKLEEGVSLERVGTGFGVFRLQPLENLLTDRSCANDRAEINQGSRRIVKYFGRP